MITLFASIITAFSLVAILGYILGLRWLYCLSVTPMALNTAISFLLVGISLLWLNYEIKELKKEFKRERRRTT